MSRLTPLEKRIRKIKRTPKMLEALNSLCMKSEQTYKRYLPHHSAAKMFDSLLSVGVFDYNCIRTWGFKYQPRGYHIQYEILNIILTKTEENRKKLQRKLHNV